MCERPTYLGLLALAELAQAAGLQPLHALHLLLGAAVAQVASEKILIILNMKMLMLNYFLCFLVLLHGVCLCPAGAVVAGDAGVCLVLEGEHLVVAVPGHRGVDRDVRARLRDAVAAVLQLLALLLRAGGRPVAQYLDSLFYLFLSLCRCRCRYLDLTLVKSERIPASHRQEQRSCRPPRPPARGRHW